MFRSWREGSLRMAIITSFTLLVAVVLVIVTLGLAARSRHVIREDAIARTRQSVTQVNASLGECLSGALGTMGLFKSLVEEASDVSGPALTEFMRFVKLQNANISSLAVFTRTGEALAVTAPGQMAQAAAIQEAAWFKQALKARPSTVSVSSPYLQTAFSGRYAWVSTLSTQVEYTRLGRTETGVLSMDLHFSAIGDLLDRVRLGDSGYVYLLDPEYRLIYHNQLPLIQLGLRHENTDPIRAAVFGEFFDAMDGRERLIVVQTVDKTRWRLVGVSYMDEVMAVEGTLMRTIASFLAAGIFLALAVAIVIGRTIAQPMNRLTRIIRSVEGGDLNVDIPQQGFLEIANLASAFHLMLGRIKLLMHQIVLEQEQKRLYELEALQAQINPHFLYNTLDSIVWMQERGHSPEAIQMVTALARLFRISISKGRSVITVAEEIEHVRNYLIIQSIRFKNKFTYSITVEPAALRLRTVKLVLQPIVENAIVHGLAHFATDEGRIEIGVSIEEGRLTMRVRDNGQGMRREQVEGMFEAHTGKGGSGLRNVHERIVLTYGEAYGVTIESEPDEGTLVTLMQPILPAGGFA